MFNNTSYYIHKQGMASRTSGWQFDYKLVDKIDCDSNIQDRDNIIFATKTYGKKSQNAINGFSITSQELNQEDAEKSANSQAIKLTQLLVASSGIHSKFSATGYKEITESGRRRIGTSAHSSYSIRNNAILSMNDDKFQDILKVSDKFTEKIHFISKARKAEKSKDFESIIKYLVQACNDNPQGELEKFKFLRHVISHNKGKLYNSTICRLKEGFGENYFQLIDNKFDFESEQNIRNLKIQAKSFLKTMHSELRQELEST